MNRTLTALIGLTGVLVVFWAFAPIAGLRADTPAGSTAPAPAADTQISDTSINGVAQLPVIDHPPSAERRRSEGGAGVGMQMPTYTLLDERGHKVSTARFRGKVIVIDLWLTGCGPCLREMPHLAKLATAYAGKDVVFVPVCCDASDDPAGFVQRLQDFRGLGLAFYADSRGWMDKAGFHYQLHNVMGMPIQIVIDRHGKAVGAFEGYDQALDPDLSALKQSIDIALSGNAQT